MTATTHAIDRFVRYLSFPETGCWEWTGSKTSGGYGIFRWCNADGSIGLSAHRFIYEYLIEPIPPGFDVDHLCRNPSCVNPEHLEAVTHRENLMRGNTAARRNAAKAACSEGHEYAVRLDEHGRSHRYCPMCAREKARITYLARKGDEWERKVPFKARRKPSHCRRGHPFEGDNVYVLPDGRRNCRECHRQVDRKRRARERLQKSTQPLQE